MLDGVAWWRELTLIAHGQFNAMMSFKLLTMDLRIGNALVSYVQWQLTAAS